MLKKCAPGHSRELKKHNVLIRYKAKAYRKFPAGPHGKARGGSRYDVQIGHVRNMVRFFGIRECAKEHLPAL